MELTDKQTEGLFLALDRYQKGERYTIISGFAGVGKSTLVQHIIAAIGAKSDDVVYCAYTGKATLVLASKGCKNTSTLHKLLFKAILNTKTGIYSFVPRTMLEQPYKIVVIDELSMVPADMWELLKRHRVYILALGDPEQLGPVRATDDTGMLKDPHVFLDQIMRQAEGNEIIKLSMDIRLGKPLTEFKGNTVQVISADELSTGMLNWADQILCAKNDTRFKLNYQLRQLQGRGEEPEIGDKVICLTNYWESLNDCGETPLVNGTLGYITDVDKVFDTYLGFNVLRMSFETELGEQYSDLTVDYKMLTTNVPSLTRPDFGRLSRNVASKKRIPKEFAYGSAITTWKAQGSEWDNILLFEEGFPWKVEEHKRYLYTGITRASEKLVVVMK